MTGLLFVILTQEESHELSGKGKNQILSFFSITGLLDASFLSMTGLLFVILQHDRFIICHSSA
jgi:hypothetical protein